MQIIQFWQSFLIIKYIIKLKIKILKSKQKNVNLYLAKSANNAIFQIQSTQFTNFFYNSSANDTWKYQQNMPLFDFDEWISLLVEKYNYSKGEIHIGIFQNNELSNANYNSILKL